MKFRKYTLPFLAAAVFAACSEPENTATPDPAPSGTITLLSEGTQQVTAYAFRLQGDRYLFDTLYREGWSSDGRLSVRMRSGRYKFLFASGAGEHLIVGPEPLTGQTAWEEIAFTLTEDAGTPGTYLPADELFLQFPATDAETVYTVAGTEQTIQAHLTRAVCRIVLLLKRGYRDGARYVEVPYAAPRSVLDQIGGIDLTASGTGLSVRPAGTSGSATVHTICSAADFTLLPETGFARLEGPYLLPSADGSEIGLDLLIEPAAGAAAASTRLQLSALAERNKQLEITLWITSAYPEIGVEIRTAPISEEQEGDTGIWE